MSEPARPIGRLRGELTMREKQVLERIIAGRLNKQIQDDLSISIKTVEAHRANIMEKMGANSSQELFDMVMFKTKVKHD